jgi:hypothetical protein
MYYDLVASLPHPPHFERAEQLPITRLRLDQRLRLLVPAHAEQLVRAQSLISWLPDRVLGTADAAQANEYAALMASRLEPSLREYVAFRMDQKTLTAALRRKRSDVGLPPGAVVWGVGPRVRDVQMHWDEPDFHLALLYPWLPQARELLTIGDARGLERLLMDINWRWLTSCAEKDTFGFAAVFSYFFKWDILRAWLICDPQKAKTRFTDLIDQVTHVEHN